MKVQVHIDGKTVWKSNRISAKKVDELRREYKCQTMPEIVRRGFKVFMS